MTHRLYDRNKTVIISDQLKRIPIQRPESIQDASISTTKRMALFILGMVERVDFAETPIITLGRFDRYSKTNDQIDLTGYDAINKGISRIHCQIELQDKQIVITDLGSTNGTFIANKRLEPNQPEILPRGAELIIGRLPIQIVSGQ